MSPRAGLDNPTIVRAAVELADKNGVEEVTLAALAAKLGVRSPSLYNHISGLAGLKQQLTVYGLEQMHKFLSLAIQAVEPSERIHAMGSAYVNFARQHPGLYEMTIKAPEPQNTEHEEMSEKILILMVEVLESYNLGEEGRIHAVRGFRSLLHGFASLEQKGGFGIPLEPDISLSRLISTFIAGISSMKD